jgi:glutamate synthase domain-containing protein 3
MLGLRRVEEMVGRIDLLDLKPALDHWKSGGLDLAPVLERWTAPAVVRDFCSTPAAEFRFDDLNRQLLEQARPALETGRPIELDLPIRNVFRTSGTLLSSEIFRRHGEDGLPENTIILRCRGSAGQSFFAFGAPGITVITRGDANDYFGKGLSGAILVLRPPEAASFAAEQNVIVGNTAFYGATAGQAYIRGIAGERFCVRNSGVSAVVEGTGDHACEYMTGGRVVILGPTGYNTAAGMSGGEAYIYDDSGDFGRHRCNRDMVDLEPLEAAGDIAALRDLVERHHRFTDSPVAARILEDWDRALQRFVKIMPRDYKRALARLAREQQSQASGHETANGRLRSPQHSGEIV